MTHKLMGLVLLALALASAAVVLAATAKGLAGRATPAAKTAEVALVVNPDEMWGSGMNDGETVAPLEMWGAAVEEPVG